MVQNGGVVEDLKGNTLLYDMVKLMTRFGLMSALVSSGSAIDIEIRITRVSPKRMGGAVDIRY